MTPGQWELASVTKSISGGNVTPEMRTALVGKTMAYDACIPADEAAAPDANFFAGARRTSANTRIATGRTASCPRTSRATRRRARSR
ncbi:MAG: hypothetical protein AVDCRST_MAG91-654 [uncultured Sphingomonadaceae bacterium]|uniref:Uncharacterized protein n=1 Tax=uncultured Sphingomonadaceae bacterium TaxID=169976 RepID=A0A6J4S9T2_9SPHN|nr:MAG: hypothetical protein AVDCRST_MAG91-654 [uncultured Sphingomonadaceae bacterium]